MRQTSRMPAMSGRSASPLVPAAGSAPRRLRSLSSSGCCVRPWQYVSSSLSAGVITACRSLAQDGSSCSLVGADYRKGFLPARLTCESAQTVDMQMHCTCAHAHVPMLLCSVHMWVGMLMGGAQE